MKRFLEILKNNSSLVVALATVVLAVITYFYLVETQSLRQIAEQSFIIDTSPKVFLKNIYLENHNGREPADEGIEEKIIRSLSNDEPFEPVFDIDGQRLRIEKITIEQGKLTLQLVPTGGPDTVVE